MCFEAIVGENCGTTALELDKALREPDVWRVLIEHKHDSHNRLWVVRPDDIRFNLTLSLPDNHKNIALMTYCQNRGALGFDDPREEDFTATELVRFMTIKAS
jgi:hypothetical protein